MNGEGKKSRAEKVPLLHPSGWVKAELSMKQMFLKNSSPIYERIYFWEVCLSCLKNCVSADAIEGIFDIKF